MLIRNKSVKPNFRRNLNVNPSIDLWLKNSAPTKLFKSFAAAGRQRQFHFAIVAFVRHRAKFNNLLVIRLRTAVKLSSNCKLLHFTPCSYLNKATMYGFAILEAGERSVAASGRIKKLKARREVNFGAQIRCAVELDMPN